MNLDPGALKPVNRARGGDGKPERALGHLNGVDPAQGEPQQGSGAELGEQERDNKERAGRARRDAGQTCDGAASAGSAERCDEHAIDGARGVDCRDRGRRGIHRFNIDIEARGRESRERFGERAEALSAAEVDRRKLSRCEIAHAPWAARNTIENVVVTHYRDTVARGVNVGLQIGHSEIERGAKGGEGVLGCANGKSPVREDSRPGTCQKLLRRQGSDPSA